MSKSKIEDHIIQRLEDFTRDLEGVGDKTMLHRRVARAAASLSSHRMLRWSWRDTYDAEEEIAAILLAHFGDVGPVEMDDPCWPEPQ